MFNLINRHFPFACDVGVRIARSSLVRIARDASVNKNWALVKYPIIISLCAINLFNYRLRLLTLRSPSSSFLMLMLDSSDRRWFGDWRFACWGRTFTFSSYSIIWGADNDQAEGWVCGAAIGCFRLKQKICVKSGLFWNALSYLGFRFEILTVNALAKYLEVEMQEREDETKHVIWLFARSFDFLTFQFLSEQFFLLVCYLLLQGVY